MTKTILIADDSPSIRRVVSIALSSAGYHVYEAVDGQGALDILGRKDVNLIISDDYMPDMDGIALLSEIQKNQITKIHRLLCCCLSWMRMLNIGL